MGAGTGAHHHRLKLEVRAGDLLPTAITIAAAKDAALSGVVAELANLPWPPGPDAHALLDFAPILALAMLEVTCEGVAPERLARCLGLDPLDGPSRLTSARTGGEWPGRAYRAAMAVMEGAR